MIEPLKKAYPSMKKEEPETIANEDADLEKQQETKQPRKSPVYPRLVINEDDDLKKNQEPKQKSQHCKKHAHPKKVSDSDDDSSEEEPCSIYNCAEARRLF